MAGPYTQQVFVESVSSVTATNSVEVGITRQVGSDSYRYVYNDGASTLSVSYGCIISLNSGYSVTVSSTTSTDFLVGVCKNTDIPAGSYGWVLTQGFVDVEMEADNSAAAGNLLILAADGEFAFKSNATGYPGAPVGKALEAIASGASGKAYIRA